MSPGPVSVDCETSGLHWWEHDAGVVSFAWGPLPEQSWATRNIGAAVAVVQERMRLGYPCVFHNSAFDVHFLVKAGLKPNWRCVQDTLLMSRLVDNLSDHRLKSLGEAHFGIKPLLQLTLKKWLVENRKLYKTKYGRLPNYLDAPDDILLPYAAEDTRLTWMLYDLFRYQVNGQLYERELRLQELMFNVEIDGIHLDIELASKRSKQAHVEARALKDKLLHLKGDDEFNPDSNTQLVKWLYQDLGLQAVTYTPKGAPQVNDFNLASNRHPVTALLRAYNKRVKSGEFFDSYLGLVAGDGMLHPTINTMAARTHRFSCQDPNLQQIPSRNDRFKTREVFFAESGYYASADYNKQELFIAACEAGEETLLADLAAGNDVYSDMARVMLNKQGVTSSERQAAKIAVLSIIYGVGSATLSEGMTINLGRRVTPDEAGVIKANWKRGYPGMDRMMQNLQRQAMSQGRIINRWGRVLNVEKDRAYVATDYLVQSSGRDVLADALLNVASLLPEYGGHLLPPIHDEVPLYLPERPDPIFLNRFADAMVCTKFQLPLTASPKWGKRLSDLK